MQNFSFDPWQMLKSAWSIPGTKKWTGVTLLLIVASHLPRFLVFYFLVGTKAALIDLALGVVNLIILVAAPVVVIYFLARKAKAGAKEPEPTLAAAPVKTMALVIPMGNRRAVAVTNDNEIIGSGTPHEAAEQADASGKAYTLYIGPPGGIE